MSRKLWTKQEDKVLIKYINDESLNLAEAFRKASRKLGRSVLAVQYRWYGVLNNPKNKGYIGSSCFVTVCRKRAIVNRKIATSKSNCTPIKMETSWWRRLLSVMRIKK